MSAEISFFQAAANSNTLSIVAPVQPESPLESTPSEPVRTFFMVCLLQQDQQEISCEKENFP